MQVSGGYRILDAQAAAAYAAQVMDLGAPVTAREVGDGNLNLVFICSGPRGSVVLKQALPFVRVAGEGWPLGRERNRFEGQALELEGSFVPDLVPAIYHRNDELSVILIEDLSRLQVVRHGLCRNLTFPCLGEHVARFMAQTLARTSDHYLASAEKKQAVARFISPELCKITEDLVLTDPFRDAPTNRFEPGLRPAMEALWSDGVLLARTQRLRRVFMTRAEALCHGDLHTGSIMADGTQTRVIDPEFAFFGPFGLDPGMFVANLFISAQARRTAGGARGAAAARWAVDTAGQVLDWFARQFTAQVRHAPVWPLGEMAARELLAAVMADTAGFAGAEVIRRTAGFAQVHDLQGIADEQLRLVAKKRLLELGRRLILDHERVHSPVELMRAAGD